MKATMTNGGGGLSRREFLKSLAAGAGLALATGIPGIAPTEAATGEDLVGGSGFADFLIGRDGEMNLVGQIVRIEQPDRVVEEINFDLLGEPGFRGFSGPRVDPILAEVVIDQAGYQFLDAAILGDYVDVYADFCQLGSLPTRIILSHVIVTEFRIEVPLDHGSAIALLKMIPTQVSEAIYGAT